MNKLTPLVKITAILLLTLVLVSCENLTISPLKLVNENLLLRKIGDQFLRSTGDRSTRIFPVENISPQEFRLKIASHTAFLPDSLVATIQKLRNTGAVPKHFSFTITAATGDQIVYGFTSRDLQQHIVPCLGRMLPAGDYAFTLLVEPSATMFFSHPFLLISLISIGLILTTFYFYGRKSELPVLQAPGIAIGRYQFDPARHSLTFEGEQTGLTAKEQTLLSIFSNKLNEVIDRNALLKEGWEDEGVITGRSLDMYVSKLRKKLGKDPLVKITNFHGKGYALEILRRTN